MIEKVIMAATFFSVAMAMVGNRPDRKPGNLAPIQLISAVGAWALVLANASAMAVAIRDGSLILLCTVAATVATALMTFVHAGVTSIANSETPKSLNLVVDELKQLLGGAPRLGLASLEAVVVAGRCPGISVAVVKQGHVVVRVRRDVVQWLERQQYAGGAGTAAVASFVRFTVLHEIGHVLNGDHRTFRFVRGVLIAHLVWLPGALALAASLVLNRETSATPLTVAASIVLLFAVQVLVARRFISERERLADWRAVQTLAPADAARLLERQGRRRGAANPTELEKLMTGLKAQAPLRDGGELLARLISFVWPEGDDIHQRAERAGGDRAGGPPQPVRWAALVGMQCGFFSVSLALAAMFAAAPWIGWRRNIAEALILTIMPSLSAPAVTFCEMRVDPARMSVGYVKRTRVRVVVGIVFFLAFTAAALTLYPFYVRFGITSMPLAFHFTFMLMMVAGVVSICVWMSAVFGGSDGGGELRDVPRSPSMTIYMVAAMALVLFPLSIAATYWLAIGSFRSWHWAALMFMSFSTFVVSTAMARSTNATLRMIAPMALLDTPAPVHGYRVFWRDFYVDLSRTTLPRATAIAVAVQMVAMPFFVLIIGLLMQRVRAVLSAQVTYSVFFYGAMGVMLLILVIPDRYKGYSGPWMRLLDTSRLQVFEKLLAAARTADPPAADRLNSALSLWLRNDRFPDTVLPDSGAVWKLAPLLSLVRLARKTGESAVLARWRDRIERSLRQVVSNDAVAIAPGQPPSIHWTTLAATIISEVDLREAFPFERMLDRIETLLDERLALGTDNLLADVVASCTLLRRQGRPGPDPQSIRRFARSSSLVARPRLRQSLAELCELADLTGDSELRVRLGLIVRSRAWEVLQLNARKDVLLLLDCYLAAACLGETDSRHAAATVVIGELARRVSDELNAIVNG